MMRAITLSGWGQPHDALSGIAPYATPVGYAHHDSVDAALKAIAAHQPEIMIGWSLGGQLCVRAMAAGLVRPKKLVLIAAPFQFVDIGKNGLGMAQDTFGQFAHNFLHHPLRTLHKAWELVAHDDARAPLVRESLGLFSKDAVLAHDWLSWLKRIEGFSCESLDFSGFPPTLIVHGRQDAVVHHAQSTRFAERIAGARLELWEGCSHAPHWHDPARLQSLIEAFHV